MPNNKARRVTPFDYDPPHLGGAHGSFMNDPNGTHHLAHVDHFEVVPTGVWEKVVNALKAIEGNCEGYGDSHAVGAYNIANRALAEIGTMPEASGTIDERCNDE